MVTASKEDLIPEAFREIVRLRPLTAEDLTVFPDDRNRYEIIVGHLIVSPSPSTFHQHVLVKLASALDIYLSTRGSGAVYVAPLDVRLSFYDVVQPDLLVVLDDRREVIQEHAIVGAPNLVVEFLSPSSRITDRVDKAALYASSGVQEYWIVNPENETVSVQTLENERYLVTGEYSRNDTLHSTALDGFTLELSSVFPEIKSESAQTVDEDNTLTNDE